MKPWFTDKDQGRILVLDNLEEIKHIPVEARDVPREIFNKEEVCISQAMGLD